MATHLTEVTVNNPGYAMVQCQLWLQMAVEQSQWPNF